jgi:predicted DNA-binding antitoxin AbrB/MazE fold protein
MTTYSVPAIYKDGVLRPQTKLDLPEDTPVQLEVTPLTAQTASGPLYGAFPALASMTESDLTAAKQAWDRSLDAQADILSTTD